METLYQLNIILLLNVSIVSERDSLRKNMSEIRRQQWV